MLTENDRLTHEHANGWYSSSSHAGRSKYWSAATKLRLMERLAAYEDTGLTPEEILAMRARERQARHDHDL